MFQIGKEAGADVQRFARDVGTEFDKLRINGVAKVRGGITMADLPTDGSFNLAIPTDTSKGEVPVYLAGGVWYFFDDTVMS